MRTASTSLLQNIPASCACTLPFFNISKLVLRKVVLGWIHTGTSTAMHICHGIIPSILCSKTFWFVGMSSFTALQHILGHFERSQLAYPHCSWANKKTTKKKQKQQSSFKRNENIKKKEDESYYAVSANKASPATR